MHPSFKTINFVDRASFLTLEQKKETKDLAMQAFKEKWLKWAPQTESPARDNPQDISDISEPLNRLNVDTSDDEDMPRKKKLKPGFISFMGDWGNGPNQSTFESIPRN